MEKKIYKFSIPQNQKHKNIKKLKELKLLSNYVPVKKTHFQSNISEYETEPSLQKNFPNKNPQNAHKPNTQAKSVQNTHSNQFSPNKLFNNSANKRVPPNKNALNSNYGSLYNLNNLNNNDFSNEKKIIEKKMTKINALKKQLSYYYNSSMDTILPSLSKFSSHGIQLDAITSHANAHISPPAENRYPSAKK